MGISQKSFQKGKFSYDVVYLHARIPGGNKVRVFNFGKVRVFHKAGHRASEGRVPNRLPMAAWGPGRCGSKRMWCALKALRGKEEAGPPKLEKEGRRLTLTETLEEAEKRWGHLYRHPRRGASWCGETEWDKRLEEVKRVVAKGRRIWTEVEPPDWDTFRTYVRQLPEGKGGAGMTRYEMYKYASEEELKIWYERVVLPVVRGEWEPGQWLKEADLALVYKKGDGTELGHYRGIGLLTHTFKILEWAILSSVWRKIVQCVDHEIFGYVHNRSVCQALWRARAENDKRRRHGQEWIWLSLDLQACFDTVLREVGLAASEGLGVDPAWGDRSPRGRPNFLQ